MDNAGNIIDFLKNPVTAEYLSYNDSVFRYSVSSISAVCEMLGSSTGKSRTGTDCHAEIVNCMMSVCCNLMRVAELNTMLANISSEDEPCYSITDLSDFMKDFYENCNLATEKKIRVDFHCDNNIKIKTDENILTYLMLRFMRNTALNHVGKVQFELTGKRDGHRAEICLKAETGDNGQDFCSVNEEDFFERHFSEVNSLFLDKLGFEIVYGSDFMKITCPLYDGNVHADFRNRNIIYGTEMFSKYNIMLGDIAGNR